jgi:hypothetical protein
MSGKTTNPTHAAAWTPGRAGVRLAAISTVSAALLSLAAAWLPSFTSLPAIQPILFPAIAVAWLGSLASSVCVARAVGRPPIAVATALLIGIGLRLLVTLAAALTIWAFLPADARDAFLIAVGVVQSLLLIIDSAAQLGLARRLAQPIDVSPGRPAHPNGLDAAELR